MSKWVESIIFQGHILSGLRGFNGNQGNQGNQGSSDLYPTSDLGNLVSPYTLTSDDIYIYIYW